MKTDSIFYRIFLEFPEIFFKLIKESESRAENYKFVSIEVKQVSFRLDGLYSPNEDSFENPFYLVEAQSQVDEDFYYRLFGELFLYLKQYKPQLPWQIVVIYPKRSIERLPAHQFAEMVSLERVKRVYLDELEIEDPPSLGIEILKLIIKKESEAVDSAKMLINQAKTEVNEPLAQENIIDLIETIIVYKLPLKTLLGNRSHARTTRP